MARTLLSTALLLGSAAAFLIGVAHAAPAAKAAAPKAAAPKAAAPKAAAPAAGSAAADDDDSIPATSNLWQRNEELRGLHETYQLPALQWKRTLTREDTSLAAVRRVVGGPLDAQSEGTLARALYVLEMEAPAEGAAFAAKLNTRVVERHSGASQPVKVNTGPEIQAEAAQYHELYDVPCRGTVKREGKVWPPSYVCSDPAVGPSSEPTAFVALSRAPRVIPPSNDTDKADRDPPKGDPALAKERLAAIAERDAVDPELLKRENLASMPTQFCVKGQCFGTYAQVAAALYGQAPGADTMPVFCAPSEKKGAGDKAAWDTTKVACSAQWLDTLGAWRPWERDGEASTAPPAGTIPPFACFGSPHIMNEHMVLPRGGAAGQSGFFCRNRLFRVLAKKAEMSRADERKNIALLCAEMRMQVWGEKYPNITREYQAWCEKDKDRVAKGLCLPPGTAVPGEAGGPQLPFMPLSREELLFFFGHKELFCRADRAGLTHRLYNKDWAPSFTCNIPRGLLEAGPFEEGVQTCAVSPFVGEEPLTSALTSDQLKARLHCWKFDRPTCEEVSNPELAQRKDSLHNSNVFDAFDALREARRSSNKEAFSLYDMKDSEKLADYQDKLAFTDQGKDEGTFGVKEFCRFVGGTASPSDTTRTASGSLRADGPALWKLQCGYTKESMAHFYELRASEAAEGCQSGICVRGAFRRGYYCALMSSTEYFEGKAYWGCGIDVGVAGQAIVGGARAVCIGGARAQSFLSAKGDKGSLQCYERRFRWGESEQSEDLLRRFHWTETVKAVAKVKPHYDAWLHGGQQAEDWAKAKMTPDMIKSKSPAELTKALLHMPALIADIKTRPARVRRAKTKSHDALLKDAAKDAQDVVIWAARNTHTLGHRTSMRALLAGSDLPAMVELRKVNIKAETKFSYKPLGLTCTKKPNECVQIAFVGDTKKEHALTKEKAKALNDLVKEVVKGRRSADDKWYQDFRLEATEEGQLRVDPKVLELALRVHHVYEILAGARRVVLRQAKLYADMVFNKAAKAERVSRLEVHERARHSTIPAVYKGNIFCVSDSAARDRMGTPEYVCASSPLLVAGAVERRLYAQLEKNKWFQKRSAENKEKMRQKARGKMKFGWCYGGSEGAPLYGYKPSAALAVNGLSSPFEMEIPKPVLADGKVHNMRFLLHQKGPKRDKKGKLIAATPAAKATSAADFKSNANWVRCAGFQYSDEAWEEADPKREPKPAKDKAVAGAPSGIDPRASSETAKIMQEVGGLVVSVVKVVLPKFGDALQRVQDLAHAGVEFYDKYVKKFVDLAKKVWDAARGDLQAAEELRDKLRNEIQSAMGDARKAAVDAAKPQASDAATTRVKAAEADADAKVKEKQTALTAHEKATDAAVKKHQKNVTIPDTGELLAPLLEDLIKMATDRVAGIIEPNAKALLAKGFKFVRGVLDPIAQSVISSLAGIPFIGAGLAAMGQIAYSMGMDALEGAAGDALMGVVERLLGKLMRGVMTPVFKVVTKKVLELATGFCTSIMGAHSKACPKEVKFAALPARDEWLNRAMACKPRELIDSQIQREAAVAELHILQTGERMQRNVAVYTRDLADRYLAQFGLSYDGWMASVGGGASPEVVARATEIQATLARSALRHQQTAPAVTPAP